MKEPEGGKDRKDVHMFTLVGGSFIPRLIDATVSQLLIDCTPQNGDEQIGEFGLMELRIMDYIKTEEQRLDILINFTKGVGV